MAPSHYFDETPQTPSEPKTISLLTPDVSLSLTTDRGVFSADRVDSGTKFLLVDGPTPPMAGRLLDLGCGYGPIAISLAKRSPGAEIWAVDINQRALDLCEQNAEAASVTVRTARPDAVPDELTFDQIWSNPPIRIGKAALHELLTFWLGRLNASGTAHLVVQKHLGAKSLAGWLTDEGWSVEQRRARSSYRIIDVKAS